MSSAREDQTEAVEKSASGEITEAPEPTTSEPAEDVPAAKEEPVVEDEPAEGVRAEEPVVLVKDEGLFGLAEKEPEQEPGGERNVSVFRGRVVGVDPEGPPTPLRVARWLALGLAVAGTIGACGAGAEVALLSLAGLNSSFIGGLAAIVVVSLVVVWLQAWLVDRAARRRSSQHWFWSVALSWVTVLVLVASTIAQWVTLPAAAGGIVVNAVLLGCLQFHRATRQYLGEDL
jgi:hypothetical protein